MAWAWNGGYLNFTKYFEHSLKFIVWFPQTVGRLKKKKTEEEHAKNVFCCKFVSTVIFLTRFFRTSNRFLCLCDNYFQIKCHEYLLWTFIKIGAIFLSRLTFRIFSMPKWTIRSIQNEKKEPFNRQYGNQHRMILILKTDIDIDIDIDSYRFNIKDPMRWTKATCGISTLFTLLIFLASFHDFFDFMLSAQARCSLVRRFKL